MARVNSKDPKHRATVARQQKARSVGVRGGSLKSHFVTKSGKRIANRKPTYHTKEGLPVFTAATKVAVVDFDGVEHTMDARFASVLMGAKEIPYQQLVPA